MARSMSLWFKLFCMNARVQALSQEKAVKPNDCTNLLATGEKACEESKIDIRRCSHLSYRRIIAQRTDYS